MHEPPRHHPIKTPVRVARSMIGMKPASHTARPGRPLGKAIRAPGHFPNEAAAMKCVCMAPMSLDPTGKDRKRWTMRWKAPLSTF